MWEAAVNLRGSIEPADYKRYVLPIIFLRFLSLRFERRRHELAEFLHQMAGIDVQKAQETFNIPEGYEAVTGIALGYPANPEDLPEEIREQEKASRARKALGEFVFSGSWGNRADGIGV